MKIGTLVRVVGVGNHPYNIKHYEGKLAVVVALDRYYPKTMSKVVFIHSGDRNGFHNDCLVVINEGR